MIEIQVKQLISDEWPDGWAHFFYNDPRHALDHWEFLKKRPFGSQALMIRDDKIIDMLPFNLQGDFRMKIRIEKEVKGGRVNIKLYADNVESNYGSEITGHTKKSTNGLRDLLEGKHESFFYGNYSRDFEPITNPEVATPLEMAEKIKEVKAWVDDCKSKDLQNSWIYEFEM